jgi:hypothetical protein
MSYLPSGPLLTVPQAAAHVGRSSKWVRRRIAAIGYIRDGGLLIPRANLEAYLTERYTPPARPADPGELLDKIMGSKRPRKASRAQADGANDAK